VWLARRGWTVTGVDFAGVGLAKARRLADEAGVDAEWVESDLLDYAPEAGSADLVIVFYLQVPAEHRRGILRSAASAVAPGGTFLLVGHDASNLEHGHGGPQDPSVLYTAEDVVGDLDGLEIERAEVVERPVETAVALDVLVRATRP
jgi:SAM-dependent methyltransferase